MSERDDALTRSDAGPLFECLFPNAVLKVVRAKRLDQAVRAEWRRRHGIVAQDGKSGAGGAAFDDLQVELVDPCPDRACLGALYELRTGVLEEMQTLMYLGRDGCTGSRWASRGWGKVARQDLWASAVGVFGSINKGERDHLIRKIEEKAPLEYYFQAALARIPIDESWARVLTVLEPLPIQRLLKTQADGDMDEWDRTWAGVRIPG